MMTARPVLICYNAMNAVAPSTSVLVGTACGRKPADPYPDQEYVVRRCLKVVLKEEAEHHRYAVRDLAALEAGA